MKLQRVVLTLLLTVSISSIQSMESDPLIQAIMDKDMVALKAALVQKNPNYYSPSDECAPLFLACAVGNTEIVEELLNAGAGTDFQPLDANGNPVFGPTPLTLAARDGHVAICKLLLERGANTNPRTSAVTSPLHAAAYNGNPEIIKMLIAHGALIDAQNSFGVTPLHQTILSDNDNDHYRACALLLQAGANPNLQTWYYNREDHRTYCDRTPLMLAALYKKKLFVHALLLYKADRNIRDKHRKVPRELLAYKDDFLLFNPQEE